MSKKTAAPRFFVAVPTYDNTMSCGVHAALAQPGEVQIIEMLYGSSLLASAFNSMWAKALNMRKAHNVQYFAMLHSDISPEAGWLAKMHWLMSKHKADVLSVVSPIKTKSGLTSTALERADDKWHPRRLTMHELYNDFEPTFTHPDLLVNTGCMLVDFRKPWVEKYVFTINDDIIQDEKGKFQTVVEPEDWHMSRFVKKNGGTLVATREVGLNHVGTASYGNASAWGTAKTDKKEGE